MYYVEVPTVFDYVFQCISPHEFERIVRLCLDIYANDFLEAGLMIAGGCAAGTTKKIK